MKHFLFFCSLILLAACAQNHYHDGIYLNETGLNKQVLTVDANKVLLEIYDYTGDVEGKIKMDCIQYPDRIEFTEKNGVTEILTLTKEGKLMLSEYVQYKKIGTLGDTYTVTKGKYNPVIKINEDGTIEAIKPENSKSKISQLLPGLFEGTKRFEDEDGIYCREVTIRDNKIKINLLPGHNNSEFSNQDSLINSEEGYIKEGKIFIKERDKYRSDLYKFVDGKLIVNYSIGD